MSAPFGPYALTLDDVTKQMRSTFAGFTDPRRGKNKSYTMVDAALSAFSVFFTQSPSFLEYQRSLEQAHGNNNAGTLFGVHEIPSDNHIRSLLDAPPPDALKPVYALLFDALEQAGVVDSLRSADGTLLLALDGTEHFSSQAIHCGQCSTRTHANGKVTHFHAALTPVLAKPGCERVIPLAPEFVRRQALAGRARRGTRPPQGRRPRRRPVLPRAVLPRTAGLGAGLHPGLQARVPRHRL
jgi:hypothetical protein